MLAPSPSSSTSSSVKAAAAAPSVCCSALPGVTAATQRTAWSATAAADTTSSGEVAVPTNTLGSGVRALPAGTASLSPPVLLSSLNSCSAATPVLRQAHHHLLVAPASGAHSTANASGNTPTEAGWQVAGAIRENDAAARTGTRRCTSLYVRAFQPEAVSLVDTTAPAALPAALAGTYAIGGAAATQSAKAAILAAHSCTTAACVHIERMTQGLTAKLKADATQELRHADPLLANRSTEEGTVSTARQKQQQWRQVELLQRQQELQHRLLVLQEQQRQRDDAAAADSEGWTSCRWISTDSDNAGDEEGRFSASDANACTASSGDPSENNSSCRMSFPKESFNGEGFSPASARSGFLEEPAHSAAAAGADHASTVKRDSAATRENIQAGDKMRGLKRQADFEFAASRATAATSAATGAVVDAASSGNAHAPTSLQSESNGLYFPYLLWQEDEDIDAAAQARAEPADTSTHAHSGNSSPVEEVTNEPLALGGAGATAAAADAPRTPASNRDKSDKLQEQQIRYPFPEAAVLWESSGSCYIDELCASAFFDEESHQQPPQRQRLPLRHPCSTRQRDPLQEQESHEKQRTRQPLHSPEQQREVQRTVDSSKVLGSEWTDAGPRVLNSLEFHPAFWEVCGTHIGNSVADSGRGAAAGVAEVKATQVVHCPDPTCSSRLGRRSCGSTAGEARGEVGEGLGSQSATTATAAEENSATAAAAGGTAETPASPAGAGFGTCSIAAVAVRGQSGSVATAGTAAAGHAVGSSSSTHPICEATKRGATLQEALVELRRVTKTRAPATSGEATGKGTHLLLQGQAATASPLKIVPLHRHWVQQLLLQQKKQQQRVQRLQLQQRQQKLRQQRQTQQQRQQIKQQQQPQHNSEQRPTRKERHPHQLSQDNRTTQQKKARKQSDGDDRLAKMRGRSKTGNTVAAEEEEAKPLAHEKSSAFSPQKRSSCDAATASFAGKSGLPRTTRTICTLAARSALCASASAAAPAAAAPASAAPVDPPVAFGNIALPCSGAATAVPAAADAGTAGLRGAGVASSAPPSHVAVSAATAEGMPAPPVFDSKSSLRDNHEVFLASLAAADTLSRSAAADHSLTTATAALAAEVQSSFTAVDPSVIGMPSIPPFPLRDPLFSVPAANEGHSQGRAGCWNAATLAVDQEDESRRLVQENLRLAIVSSAVPPPRTATPVSHPSGGSAPTVAAAAAVAGGVHVQAASAACLSSADATVSAPTRTAHKASSTELPTDTALNISLLCGNLSLEDSRTALQRPRPSERRNHTCQAAAAAATNAQRSDSPRKCAHTAASAKNTAAATSGPGTTAVTSALAVTTTGAETAVPRPLPRQRGTTVFTPGVTKEREPNTRSSSTNYCRKSKSGRQTADRQRSIGNSSCREQQRSREKTAPSQPIGEGDSLRKKTVGRTKNAMQKFERSLKQQQQQGRQQKQEVVEDEFVVRGRQVVSRDVVCGEEMQRERAQQQHDASNTRLRTDAGKKDRRVRNEVKTTGAVILDEDTADDLELQRTLRRLRTRLLLDTSDVGSPAMTQQDEEPADHPLASCRYHSRCSSGGRQQQDPSTSTRRSSHCGAASRPPETALAAVGISQVSGRRNEPHVLLASLQKGKEGAGKSRGEAEDKLNLRTGWREMSNSQDRKDKGRGPSTDAAIIASVTAPTIGTAAAKDPARGRASAAGCGDRLQQLLTGTAWSNTAREQCVQQQKEQREQLQQQWRPYGGEGETRKGTKSLRHSTGALGGAGGASDLRFGGRCDLTKSRNTKGSTISSRCSSRSTQLSRSNQSNSSSTSYTPSTILRRLRRLLQNESSPCCVSPRYRCRRRRRLKEQAMRGKADSSCSSKSGSEGCKRTRRRDRKTRNNRNTGNSRRWKRSDSSRCTELSGSVNPSSASSCRNSSGGDSEGSRTSQRGNSSSGREIAEASKRMWRTLLKRRNRELASSSRLIRTGRHHTGLSSSSSRRRKVGNSTSSLFTDSSSEASNTNTASSSCGARSSTFADKHPEGAGIDFPASWIDRRPRNKQRKNLTAATDCIPAAGGTGVTSRGDAIDGIRAAFAGDAVAVEECTAAADGKGKDRAPSLISLWLQYSAAALEAANQQQQQQQGILTAAAGRQQLKKEVLVEKRQRSLEASGSYDLQGTSSRQARCRGKSKSGNWRRRHDSPHSSKGISRNDRKGSGLWHNSSGTDSSSTSESMRLSGRPSGEDTAFSSDPDAFIRHIKRRLRLPVLPRLKSRQQQQRQRQDSSEISGSSSRYLATDNTGKHRWTDPGQSEKHVQPQQQQPLRQQHEQQRIRQQQERQQDGVQENQAATAEECAKTSDRKADVDEEQQQREEKQNPEEIVRKQESGGQHLREGAVELQHEQERQRTAVTSAATLGTGAGVVDDPSGPLHLSALGSPEASSAKRHMKGQFCRQQEDRLLLKEQEKQEPGNHRQLERELPQKEDEKDGKEQPTHAKQQRNESEPSQQKQEPQEGRGVHNWITCICTAAPAADDDAVTSRGAGATLDTAQILHASLPSVAPQEGEHREILAAVQLAGATPDAASRTAAAQAVAAARTAVSAKSEACVTTESERIAQPREDQEVRERTDGDGTATADGAPSGDKGRKEQHLQLRREQQHQKNVSMQEKEEAPERQAKMLLRLQQEEARMRQGGTQQQDQQHRETQELDEGALEQNQPACGPDHEQPAPAVEAKEEESGKREISSTSHASEVLQSERVLGRPENEHVPSGQQQPSDPTNEVDSVAHLHTMTVPPPVPVAGSVNAFLSPGESIPWGIAAAIATAVEGRAGAAATTVTAASEDTSPLITRVIGGFGAPAARTEDPDDDSLTADVAAKRGTACTETRGDTYECPVVPSESAALVEPRVTFACEQVKVTGGPGSESAESPPVAVAAARGFTSMRYASSVESFSFSLSSSSGHSSVVDHADHDPNKHSFSSVDSSSSSRRAVNPNLTNNNCISNTRRGSRESVNYTGHRIPPGRTTTAEYRYHERSPSTNAGAAAQLRSDTEAGGRFCLAASAEGEAGATDTAGDKIAGAARPPNIRTTCNSPAPAATLSSGCLLPGSPEALRAPNAEKDSPATSAHREPAAAAVAELLLAGSVRDDKGSDGRQKDSCTGARERGASACVQPQLVPPERSSDGSNDQSRQTEVFVVEQEEKRYSLHNEGLGATPTVPPVAHGNLDEVAAPAAASATVIASSPGHVAVHAACPDGRAAKTCAAARPPLVCAVWQCEQRQEPQQLDEAIPEVMLEKEEPPGEVFALLKQQQRQLHLSTAGFSLPTSRCTCSFPASTSERDKWFPLLSLDPATQVIQQEAGRQERAEQEKCDAQQRQKLRDQKTERKNKLPREHHALHDERGGAGLLSTLIAATGNESACRREQAGRIREGMESFADLVNIMLGGGENAENSLATTSCAAPSTAAAFTADRAAALPSSLSATVYEGNTRVERTSHAAQTGPRTCPRECMLGDATASVSVPASAAASLPAAFWKGELFAAALAELQQFLRERECSPSCRLADSRLQPLNTCGTHIKSGNVGSRHEQSHVQAKKHGAKCSKKNIALTVAAARNTKGTGKDTAAADAGEWSGQSKCSSLQVCDGVRTRAAQRGGGRKAAAQRTCPKGSEEPAASAAQVTAASCEPQIITEDRRVHGAGADCGCCSALQMERILSAATTDVCAKRHKRVPEHAPKRTRRSPRRLTSRCEDSKCGTQLRCSRGHAHRTDSVECKQHSSRTNNRSINERPNSDSMVLSAASTRGERSAGNLYHFVRRRTAVTARSSRGLRSSSSKRFRSRDVYNGCPSVYSGESEREKLESSSGSAGSCGSRRLCCSSEYARQTMEERGSAQMQQEHGPREAAKHDNGRRRRARRLHHWRQQQQQQHQNKHRLHGDSQEGADGVEDRAGRSSVNVEKGRTRRCCTHDSKQQEQAQQQWEQTSCGCKRKAVHTSSRRYVLQEFPPVCLSPSLLFEQKRTGVSPYQRGQQITFSSSFLQDERRLLTGMQQLLQQRQELPTDHNLAWCWREWGGCEIYKQQRSRLQAVLREALKGHD